MPISLTSDVFEQHILRSERLRVGMLSALFATLCLGFLLLHGLLPEPLARPVGKLPAWGWFAAVMAALALYEFAVFHILGALLRRQARPPRLPRYFNVLVEMSAPSALLYLLSHVTNPVHALMMPPVFLYAVFLIMSILRLDMWLCLFAGIIGAIGYQWVAFHALASPDAAQAADVLTAPIHHVNKGLAILAMGGVAALVAQQIRRRVQASIATLEERNRIAGMFGQHVSPEVVEKLLSQPAEPESELRHVCVMFLDVRDFTAFAEQRSPQEVVGYLNALFSPMIDAVNRNRGIVNKFLGDGFMAVFGAPVSDGRDCQNAVQAAKDILEGVARSAHKGDIPPTRIGMGLHSGNGVTGSIGSTDRREYTVIGDVVNLASRIEQLNKSFGSTLLVSEETYEPARALFPDAECLGPQQIKGRTQPVIVYRLA